MATASGRRAVIESSETTMRQELVTQYKVLSDMRLNELASGNISTRCRDGMLISPTGASGDSITAETIVFARFDGTWEGSRAPSSEWMMHAEIYRQQSSANAIVHTHSDHCVALSCGNRPLPGFHYLVGLFGGTDVPCVPYSTFGTLQLAEDAAAALRDRTACLLANHGMICRGNDLVSAVRLAQRLEIMCRQYLLARQLGEPSTLSQEQWAEFFFKIGRTAYGD
jgi:L-fuculose-phosphate aldolase